MHKITTHLWYDKEAKQAAELYVSAFQQVFGQAGSKIVSSNTIHNTPSGDADMLSIKLRGEDFNLISAGPVFKLNPSISFMVYCSTKEQVDELYKLLIQGGKALMPLDKYFFSPRYAWIEDKFGLTWQPIYLEGEQPKQKIVPSLMFTKEVCGKAEEAIKFYTGIFHKSQIGRTMRYDDKTPPDLEGTLAHADFTLEGQAFIAFDSAREHDFKFNEAISLIVHCKNQQEIDYYWDKLTAVPEAEQCGWLKDKFGVSWQIVPDVLGKMLSNKDPKKVQRVTEAFLGMKKFEVRRLEEAYEG